MAEREPLSGFTVLEVTTALQGPSAGLYLADMGASVIKVEPPEGDASRFHRGVGNRLAAGALGAQFVAANRGKRSVTLDIHHEPSREAVLKLADRADVFLSNYLGSALERMGLGYKALRERNPGLVYAVANGFGPKGTLAAKRMVDGAAQARGGIASVTGAADGGPTFPGAAIADTAGGMQLALGIVTGLLARERYGIGQRVDVSSYGAQLWLQMWEITQSSLTGHMLSRQGPHHPNIPGTYGIYETKDGRGIFLAFPRTEDSWQAFCTFAGRPEVGTDERWNTLQKRMGLSGDEDGSAGQIRPILRSMFATKTMNEWTDFLSNQPFIIWDAIADYADILADAQALENGYIVERDVPTIGTRKVVGNLVHLSETPGSAKQTWPEWGQHTEEVLLELGYEWSEISAMVEHAHDVVRQKFIAQGVEPPF
jgi:crotonobetainyl-CoA:carnitine CoA-transferase CaiB-like acyl-CoA transferase